MAAAVFFGANSSRPTGFFRQRQKTRINPQWNTTHVTRPEKQGKRLTDVDHCFTLREPCVASLRTDRHQIGMTDRHHRNAHRTRNHRGQKHVTCCRIGSGTWGSWPSHSVPPGSAHVQLDILHAAADNNCTRVESCGVVQAGRAARRVWRWRIDRTFAVSFTSVPAAPNRFGPALRVRSTSDHQPRQSELLPPSSD